MLEQDTIDYTEFTEKRKDLCKKIIEVSYLRQEGHIPSSLCILDILYYLYFYRMTSNDLFILSKGHGSLGLYSILLEKQLISEEQFYSFCKKNSILGGHPSSLKIPSVLFSSGSLGHGLPIACGLALAKKIKKEPGNIYCLIGDGEANEGTTWESALLAKTYGLDNLFCIMDFNKSGERAIILNNCVNKFNSFYWKSFYCYNGNNLINIDDIFRNIDYLTTMASSSMPTFIQLNTIKGYGCKMMENNPEWHHKSPKDNDELWLLLRSCE